MNKRFVAAAVAALLALVGTGVLLAYVRGADARAMAGTNLVDVIVAKTTIPAGTTGEALSGFVEVRSIPQVAAVPGGLKSTSAAASLVSSVEIEAGEQVLTSRFSAPSALSATSPATSGPKVPAGMVRTSVLLDPQRAIGGVVTVGETVGVFISQGSLTHLQLHSVLVTAVGGAPAPAPEPTAGTAAPTAQNSGLPSSKLMVTFALTPPDAERLVWGAEHGTLWLAAEPVGTPTTGSSVVDPSGVFK